MPFWQSSWGLLSESPSSGFPRQKRFPHAIVGLNQYQTLSAKQGYGKGALLSSTDNTEILIIEYTIQVQNAK